MAPPRLDFEFIFQLPTDKASASVITLPERTGVGSPAGPSGRMALPLRKKFVPAQLVLLFVDDPRRSLQTQARALPAVGLEGTTQLLRDMHSRVNVTTGELVDDPPPKRRRQQLAVIRRELTERYFREETTRFRGLWPRRIADPLAPSLG
jgi:hypothetical protein